MRIIALIEDADVVERILKHLRVWKPLPDTRPCIALTYLQLSMWNRDCDNDRRRTLFRSKIW
jgi:hypothetical protein